MLTLSILSEGESIWSVLFCIVAFIAIVWFCIKVAWNFLTDWRTPFEKIIDKLLGK